MATASCDSDAAQLPHLLALPHQAASACVKSNCSADKRMHMVSTGTPTLATGNWRRHLRRHVGATKSYGKYDKLGANFIYAPDCRVEAGLSRLSRVSKPSLYSCNALCIFWPCNLKPAQRNKVVSCCFARNENANDGNHDQAVGQLRQLYAVHSFFCFFFSLAN